LAGARPNRRCDRTGIIERKVCIKVRGGLAGMVPDHDVDEMLMGEELTHSAEQQKMVRLPRLPSPCEKHAREGAPSRA